MGNAVPEPFPVQGFWAKTIVPDGPAIEFRTGQDITVLSLGVPRGGNAAKEGICCVYFAKDDSHFLVMATENELNKMEGTLGTALDEQTATNHALTLRYGMKKAAKEMGWGTFKTVKACFGFWFEVCNEKGVVYTFKSCADYFNHGSATRKLQKSEEERLLAALSTVCAIPKNNADSTGSGSAAPIDCNNESERAEPAKKRLKVALGTVVRKKKPEEDGICRARRPISGVRCTTERNGESRWCLEHWDLWHGKECPVWDESASVARVAWVEDPICLAWVKTTGLRCTSDHRRDSRWCGAHKAWTGKDSPVWRPVPFEDKDHICLARVDQTGLRCSSAHKADSLWCGVHKKAWTGKDPPNW